MWDGKCISQSKARASIFAFWSATKYKKNVIYNGDYFLQSVVKLCSAFSEVRSKCEKWTNDDGRTDSGQTLRRQVHLDEGSLAQEVKCIKYNVSGLTESEKKYLWKGVGRNSRKYQGVFKVKRRIKTWQVRGICFQQWEHKQVPKGGGAESVVQNGKRRLIC